MVSSSGPHDPWRIILLAALIGAVVYFNQTVVPRIEPPFIPTPTATENPEVFLNQAEILFDEGKLSQSIEAYREAILANPRILILDEATSSVDAEAEFLIQQALERVLRDRTALVIAHRLSTVQRADEIMILDQGRIEEHGDRETLANDPNSRFYQLLQTGLEEVLV